MDAVKTVDQEESVAIDQEGNLIVNKEANMSKKLIARRAVEAYREKKALEQDLESYYFD